MKYAKPVDPFEIDFIANEDEGTFELKYRGNAKVKKTQLNTSLVSLISSSDKTTKELIEDLSKQYKEPIVRKSLSELESSGRIIKSVGRSNSHSYTLNPEWQD